MLPNHRSHTRPCINRRRPKLTASLALLALALLASPHAARAQVQPQVALPPIPSTSRELKVMTWNIRGGRAIKRGRDTVTQGCRPNTDNAYINGIVKEIKDHAGLDVVALQEVYRRQATELLEKLDGHLGPNPRLYFVETLRCDGFINNYGIAIISRYPFVQGSEERVRLCRSIFDRGSIFAGPLSMPLCPGQEPRVLARVIIRVDGRPIHIYNTHLAPGGATHRAMADLIIRQVVKDRPDRAVLLGDFYMSERSAAYQVIRREFRDAWFGAPHDEENDCDGKGFTHKTMHPTEREDYVFISDGFRVEDARVTCTGELLEAFNLTRRSQNVELRVPDHLPLTVRLAF